MPVFTLVLSWFSFRLNPTRPSSEFTAKPTWTPCFVIGNLNSESKERAMKRKFDIKQLNYEELLRQSFVLFAEV
jgi:hypothetical protein